MSKKHLLKIFPPLFSSESNHVITRKKKYAVTSFCEPNRIKQVG